MRGGDEGRQALTNDHESTGQVDQGGLETVQESWMHIEIDRVTDEEELAAIEARLQRVLRDNRDAVEDWPRMQAKLAEIVEELEAAPPTLPDPTELGRGTDFLRWLGADHFAFLGYREYSLVEDGDELALSAVPGTGLGILRGDQLQSSAFQKLPEAVRERAKERRLLVLAKANSKATVHRQAYLDYVGVKKFDENDQVVGERRFLGLFSAATYTESVLRIPALKEKVDEVLARCGIEPRSHTGKQLLNVLENYPRDELFLTPIDELIPIAEAVMLTRERRQLRLFVRRDTYRRYVSCLVYLPRDRYNTAVRERMAAILSEALGGGSVEFTVRLNEAYMAQVHFVVRPPEGELISEIDTQDLERKLTEAARSWRDDLTSAISADFGEEQGARLARTYLDAFPEAYKEDFGARTASVDVGRLEAIELGPDGSGIDLSLYEKVDAGRGEARLKVYRIGPPLSLSEVLPMLSSMGVEVVDERPYEIQLDRPTYLYEFGLRYSGRGMPAHGRELFQDALRAVWDGHNEIDGFNALVLGAGLTWRQATVLRAYAKYMKQGNTPFALDYIEEALRSNVDITRLLVQLFEARFDPGRDQLPADAEARTARTQEVVDRIGRALDDVASLDHDRILRSYLTLIRATLRTNYFQAAPGGGVRSAISFKLEPSAIPELPEPRPRFEIFVYSPRVEGVHLRFGAVARGGLRWSDRRDDFRTEVLGLVKAQMVKNTVIVPVGREGRLLLQAAARLVRPRGVDGRGHRLLQDLHLRAARHHRQPRGRRDGAAARRRAPRRRRLLPRRRRRQGHRDVLRHRQRRLEGLRLLARRRVRVGRLGRLRPQGDGHHRPRGLGLGPAALPRARDRLPGRGLHRRRHRRHVRRRLRQRDALLRAHPAGGRLRPPRHLPRPRPGRVDVVRRAQAALRAAALVVAGLRPRPDLQGRRGLPAVGEVDPAQPGRPRRPRHP